VKGDIATARALADEVKALAWRMGSGGDITREVVESILRRPNLYSDQFRSIAVWLHFGGRHVFLQDANSVTLPTGDLVEILTFLKEKFPSVERVTSYGRSSTIAKKKSVEDLKELRSAGLTRLHVGLESGHDFLLAYVNKGVTAAQHIEAGQKVMESGIELSEYVVLGLGGRRWWREHATETAKVLNQINPHFIRLRSLKVLPQMSLQKKIDEGDFILQTEEEMIQEERVLVEHLDGITSTFLSDHILNLLMEVEGAFPGDKEEMLRTIDTFLRMPADAKINFRLGKRAGVYNRISDMSNPVLCDEVEALRQRIEREVPGGVEEAIAKIKESFI